ncbi:cobyrinic acid a,c-diamide synthase [Anaerotaenia torta]|uniref:cobyrinate a,c-diamide synthase n=1 Tax=Anaerotaenia torta TaxID=433293 RepID=UPI003D1CF30C
MKAPRIMMAAVGSGSGKTLLTCALLQAMTDLGKRTAAFKCGPDYIDPMFHQRVIGVPSKNLDTFFTDEETTRLLLLEGARGKDISVLEGVMGLYDGLGGIKEEASSYHMAAVSGTPILLAVDAHGMGRSVIPLIAGFLQYDRQHLIQGIILNRISKPFYETIKPEIEEQLPVQVLGYFPKLNGLQLESRHLGLLLPDEVKDLREQVKQAGDTFRACMDMEKIEAIASRAAELEMGAGLLPFPVNESGAEADADASDTNLSEGAPCRRKSNAEELRIAVARDEAFCFYYEDNLKLLERGGARLEFFSPLRDNKLPDHVHGFLLGGGYPELYARELSQNTGMKESLYRAIEGGMPSLAECGGFMYLHETMENPDGKAFPMVGAVKGSCHYTGKLVRFGYISVIADTRTFLDCTGIRGHEFHYYDSTDNGTSCIAQKPVSGKNWRCIHAGENHWWGFPHLYYYSNTEFVRRYLERVRAYAQNTSLQH